MSAPVTERGRSAVRSRATIPAQRAIVDGATNVAVPVAERVGASATAQTVRRSAEQKAYARRDDRVRRVSGVRPSRAAAPARRPQFVLLIMVLLAVGLVATLWLSTAAAADSYRLEDATAEARVLSEQAERLHQEVAVLASAPELARRAAELGMTPVQDPARLVVAPDGSVEVIGEPRAAVAPLPPAPPAGQQPPATNGTVPEGTGSPGTDTGENGTGENGTAQLASPGGEAATAEGAREEAPADADADAGTRADRRSGHEAAGREQGAADGASETGPAAGRGGGGTDAG